MSSLLVIIIIITIIIIIIGIISPIIIGPNNARHCNVTVVINGCVIDNYLK